MAVQCALSLLGAEFDSTVSEVNALTQEAAQVVMQADEARGEMRSG
jgi:hypothetical protein